MSKIVETMESSISVFKAQQIDLYDTAAIKGPPILLIETAMRIDLAPISVC
jgi:hypothetical protein